LKCPQPSDSGFSSFSHCRWLERGGGSLNKRVCDPALILRISSLIRRTERKPSRAIAKAIIFRSTQEIIKKKKFPAYQAIISAYTVACLAQRFGEAFDLELVWSHQSISPELSATIQNWAVAVDKALRHSAGARMPSEWAKKVECWDSLKEIRLEPSLPLPPELQSQPQSHQDARVA
jgi:hypothetical protein